MAEEELGAIASLDGATGAADELGAIGAASDEEGAIGAASDDDGAIGAASEELATTGAADEDGTTTALDELTATGVVVVLGRLKIQIRPMITITATIMIIQVLRFMGFALGWLEESTGGSVLVPDAIAAALFSGQHFSSVIGGVEFRGGFTIVVDGAGAD